LINHHPSAACSGDSQSDLVVEMIDVGSGFGDWTSGNMPLGPGPRFSGRAPTSPDRERFTCISKLRGTRERAGSKRIWTRPRVGDYNAIET
jgi:hypothetical protein